MLATHDGIANHSIDPAHPATTPIIHQSCAECPCRPLPDHHRFCNPHTHTFNGTFYNPEISSLYASTNGSIPSSIDTTRAGGAFYIPWRYRNRSSARISWKVFHLCRAAIDGPEAEVVVVDTVKDVKLRTVLRRVALEAPRYQGAVLVEYLLQVTHETLGNYGLENGPTTHTAERLLYETMLKEGHNFIRLCTVPVGLCRHKALLFKLLADTAGLNCALVTGHSTAGRHQWNLITLPAPRPTATTKKTTATPDEPLQPAHYIVDPTSPYFTWTKHGSGRTKAYRVSSDVSFGHGGLTLKMSGAV
ncbi:ethylene-responsive protein kinase Le-CTR1-domain-containing protein [Powellomyces hirtus]|nr:ethylene-responsive protein kinase Le-CTR1-domain-containing protein [Powellomyces hirtus]